MRGVSKPDFSQVKKRIGIQGQLLISVIFALIVIFSVLGYIVLSGAVKGLDGVTQKTIDSMAGELAGRLRISFEKSVTATDNLASYLSEMAAAGVLEPELVDQMIYDTLDNSSETATGTFVLLEPGVFSEDSNEESAPTDNSSFQVSYSRAGTLQAPIEYETASPSLPTYLEYYEKTRQAKTLLHSEPYYTEIGGEKSICGLVIAPIIANGEFIGTVGLESQVGAFQKTVDILAERGLRIQMISTGGTIVSDTDKNAILTPVDLSEDIRASIKAGSNHSIVSGRVYTVYLPLPVSGSVDPLILCVSTTNLKAASSTLLQAAAIVAGILCIVVIVAAFLYSRSIAKQLLSLVS